MWKAAVKLESSKREGAKWISAESAFSEAGFDDVTSAIFFCLWLNRVEIFFFFSPWSVNLGDVRLVEIGRRG